MEEKQNIDLPDLPAGPIEEEKPDEPKVTGSAVAAAEEEADEEDVMPYKPALKSLRLVLMCLLCVQLFGLPTALGSFVQQVLGFVPLAFYLISGYLVLRDDKDRPARIRRTIKRTAIAFGSMTVVFFLLNLLYYRFLGGNILPSLGKFSTWFNFLILNVWQYDIGSSIWFIQGLLYAYLIILLLDKWKLLKYDWIIALILLIPTLLTGELCGLIGFNIAGYSYIPGNFLTRALPYLLFGSFLHRKLRFFSYVKTIYWFVGILTGIVLIFAEMLLLSRIGAPGYYGHLIGMAIIALSLCIPVFLKRPKEGDEQPRGMSRQDINLIYYICEPVYFAISMLLILNLNTEDFLYLFQWIGPITFLVCLTIAWLFSLIRRRISESKSAKAAAGEKAQ